MKSYAKSWILKIGLIIGFLVIDLLSKYFLQRYFETGGDIVVIIKEFFTLEYVKNTGVAFGMFNFFSYFYKKRRQEKSKCDKRKRKGPFCRLIKIFMLANFKEEKFLWKENKIKWQE